MYVYNFIFIENSFNEFNILIKSMLAILLTKCKHPLQCLKMYMTCLDLMLVWFSELRKRKCFCLCHKLHMQTNLSVYMSQGADWLYE